MSQITLWLLNRVVAWEKSRPGALAAALEGAGHTVRLGRRRCVARPGEGEVSIGCNHAVDSRPGELMHEGDSPPGQADFDEYFVPIALKCLGLPALVDGRPALTPFWQARVSDPARQARLLGLFDHALHRCFDPRWRERYWGHRGEGQALAVADSDVGELWRSLWGDGRDPLREMFRDVRLNLAEGYEDGGYYRILTEAAEEFGPNVLVGYSQGGLVAAFLGWIDEHIVDPGAGCVRGVVAVQAPLRGSPLATPPCADNVMDALQRAVRSIPFHNQLRGRMGTEAVNDILDVVLDTEPLTIDVMTTALELAWLLLPDGPSKARDFLRTSRKWLSGLAPGDADRPPLAFAELDCRTLDVAGSLLHGLASTPTRRTATGAVVGASTEIGPFAVGLLRERYGLARKVPKRLLEWLAGRLVGRAEAIWRDDAMDLTRSTELPLTPSVARLRGQWRTPAVVPEWRMEPAEPLPACAGDFVIPSASQVMDHARLPALVATRINRDASHISGAELKDAPPHGLSHVAELLRLM